MGAEVFVLYAHLIFLIAFFYIIVYNGKSYIFIKAIKQTNYTPCVNRHVQKVVSVALFTQWPLRHEQCWLHCHGGLFLMAFSSISSFVSCLSHGSSTSVMWQVQIWLLSGVAQICTDLITLCHFVQFLGIQSHKQIHHLYIHHVKDMSTWFFCLMKLVFSPSKRSGIIFLNISIRGYVASWTI